MTGGAGGPRPRRRVLVTGARGFTGAAVTRLLAASGWSVVALVRDPPRGDDPSARTAGHVDATVRGDVRDPATAARAVSGVDAVVHLAGRSRVRESFTCPDTYRDVNTTGTRTLLDAATAETRATGRRVRFVLASTAAVYGAAGGGRVPETAPTAPASPYGESKLAAERLVRKAAEHGLETAVLRLFNAAGAADGRADTDVDRLIPRTLAAAAGELPELRINGDGAAVRDFVHVEDLARAYARVLDHCRPGGTPVFNVGAVAASVRDVVAAAERASGRKVPVVHAARKPEVAVSVADTGRLRGLGWEPRFRSLDAIVRDAWCARTAPGGGRRGR